MKLNYSKCNGWSPKGKCKAISKLELKPGMHIDIGHFEFVLAVKHHPKTGALCAFTYGNGSRDFIYWDNFDHLADNDALYWVNIPKHNNSDVEDPY